jgi:hypothetical protein
MKKYLSLFIVLALAFFVNMSAVKAKDGGTSSGSGDDSKIETSVKVDGSLSSSGEDEGSSEDKSLSSSSGDKGETEEGSLESKDDSKSGLQSAFEVAKEELRSKIEALRQEAKTKMEALKASIKNEKDAAKAKIKEARIASREKVLVRFDEVVKNLTDLEVRVNTKIAALEAKGVDTTAAKASIATADAKLLEIKTKIADANTLLAKSINQLTVADKATLKTLVMDTQTLVKDARQALRDAVKSLKDSVKVKLETKASEKTEVNQ